MNARVLRELLVSEWSRVENTPPGDRQPAKEQLWHGGARELAARERRPFGEVVADLKGMARELAARRRDEMVAELARDLAVSQALGQPLTFPWRRRLTLLAGVTGEPVESVFRQVEIRAAGVRVEVRT